MSERILIVDDDDLVLSCFGRVLARKFTVETALGPQLGIEAIKTRGPYAVILSDMRMPGISGLALLQIAKEHSPQTVGLILTGNSDYDGLDEAVGNGTIFRLLEKPCPSDVLVAALQEALAAFHQNTVSGP